MLQRQAGYTRDHKRQLAITEIYWGIRVIPVGYRNYEWDKQNIADLKKAAGPGIYVEKGETNTI